jgi:D-tagatose-1,6-bisphosphate aldolase subunit GatZ/KbaZ
MNKYLSDDKNGICSICSANEYVLRAAFRNASANNKVLIESTSNQVDQFGGYTGMTPQKFIEYVSGIADDEGFDRSNLLLGGDHLGPNAWQSEPAASAMDKAKDLIAAYIQAGYTKIHLDTSMHCADDKGDRESLLETQVVADRAAELCEVAEQFANKEDLPVYIIGTDVPIPGGAKEKLENIRITPVSEVEETIEVSKSAFYKRGLENAWERVIAVVVQPGVEFGDEEVVKYDRQKSVNLVNYIRGRDDIVYEAHSTDYQTRHALRQMVDDRFLILKVGPWLTFALRETLFALAMIENELYNEHKSIQTSGLIEIVEKQMIENPRYWQSHYHGDENDLRLARKYSYSDRVRYYWPNPQISTSLERLIQNLTEKEIPLNLLSQYLPMQYDSIIENKITNTIENLIYHGVARVLDIYEYAVGESH